MDTARIEQVPAFFTRSLFDGTGDIAKEHAQAKYTKHHRGYKALGIGFSPLVVDTVGRLHDDALRTIGPGVKANCAQLQNDWEPPFLSKSVQR